MRRALTTALAAGATAAALIGSPAAAEAGTRYSPVGLWAGSIVLEDGTEIDARISFHADGTACTVAPPPGPDGGVEGEGTWRRTGGRTFAFEGTERFFDGSGATTGYLRTVAAARFTAADAFVSENTATAYDPDWNEQESYSATGNLRREQSTPAPC